MSTNNMAASRRQANDVIAPGWSKSTVQNIDEPPFQFINTMDLSVVDIMLHDSPDLVIYRTEIWAVWRTQVGRKKSGVSWRNSMALLRRVALSCVPVRALLRTHGLESTLMQRCARGSAPVGALPWAQPTLCAPD